MSKKNETVLTITRKKVEEEGILIGKGVTRKVYELNGKIYKICYNKADYLDKFRNECFFWGMDKDIKQNCSTRWSYNSVNSNINEFNLYQENKDKYNFLNLTTRRKSNFKIIEQEKIDCNKVVELAEEILDDWYVDDEDILELMIEGQLSEYMDFTFKDVMSFIEENNLAYSEICLVKQWGLNKDGYLRLCDYSR